MASFVSEGVGGVTAIRPAAEIVRELVDGAAVFLRATAAMIE